jgi:hypothetical protein
MRKCRSPKTVFRRSRRLNKFSVSILSAVVLELEICRNIFYKDSAPDGAWISWRVRPQKNLCFICVNLWLKTFARFASGARPSAPSFYRQKKNPPERWLIPAVNQTRTMARINF